MLIWLKIWYKSTFYCHCVILMGRSVTSVVISYFPYKLFHSSEIFVSLLSFEPLVRRNSRRLPFFSSPGGSEGSPSDNGLHVLHLSSSYVIPLSGNVISFLLLWCPQQAPVPGAVLWFDSCCLTLIWIKFVIENKILISSKKEDKKPWIWINSL